jgi:hypothetical protein
MIGAKPRLPSTAADVSVTWVHLTRNPEGIMLHTSPSTFPAARSRLSRRLLAGAIAVGAALSLSIVSAGPAGAAETSLVSGSAISSSRAASDGWFKEENSGGSVGIAPAPDGTNSLELNLATPGSSVRALRSYGPDSVRPSGTAALAAIVHSASYQYLGLNVNFQLEFFFKPVDSAYGPASGANKCTQAGDAGFEDWCYGVIKYEPGHAAEGGWETVALGDHTEGWLGSTQPGWWPTNRIGSIAKNSFDVSFDEMLAQMSEVKLLGVGVAAGSGSPADSTGWVRSVSYSGTTYRFGDAPPAPAAPAPAPVASSDDLDQFIAASDLDVAATTESFAVGEAAPGQTAAIDPNAPLDATLPWSEDTDDFVDVYAYSEPLFLGSFPVVDGTVVVTGVDLSALEAGGHHLVFIGQTSNTVAVVQIEVAVAPVATNSPTPAPDAAGPDATGPVLAATGSDALPLGLLGAGFAALGGTVLVLLRRRAAVSRSRR